jgi:hypothetical protein
MDRFYLLLLLWKPPAEKPIYTNDGRHTCERALWYKGVLRKKEERDKCISDKTKRKELTTHGAGLRI